MNQVLDEQTQKRYQDIAEGKEPKAVVTDILWITPKRLGALFGGFLVVTVLCLDVLQLI